MKKLIYLFALFFLVACQQPEEEVLPTVVLPTNTPVAVVTTNASSGFALDLQQPTVTPLPTATATPTPPPPEPMLDRINTWLDLTLVGNMQMATGTNNAIIANDLSRITDGYMGINRWQNAPSMDGWVQYLPDGVQPPDSFFTMTYGGVTWSAVFVDGASYRALYATTSTEEHHYTLLIYVNTVDAGRDPDLVYEERSEMLRAVLATVRVQ